MRRTSALLLLAATIAGLVLALSGLTSAQTTDPPQQDPTAVQIPDPPEPPLPYWKKRGCESGRPSAKARRKITAILRNHTPFTRAEGRTVRRLTYCVKTEKKARAGERHVQKLRRWRKLNVCSTSLSNVELGKCMARRDYGWTGGQFACLYTLWNHESGWNHTRWNYAGSGAFGIPQALPAGKMASAIRYAGETIYHAAVQIRWGLGYILGRYGTPCGALAYWQANNSY